MGEIKSRWAINGRYLASMGDKKLQMGDIFSAMGDKLVPVEGLSWDSAPVAINDFFKRLLTARVQISA